MKHPIQLFRRPLPALTIILCLLFALQPKPADASHILGGEITYGLNQGNMQVNFTLYRDCNGITTTSVALDISSTCSKKTLTLSAYASYDITPVADKQCTRCGSSSCPLAYGISEILFTGTTTVNTSCCQYTISYASPSRSTNLTTGGFAEDFYVQAIANVCMGDYYSASFAGPPPLLIYKDQCNTLYQTAYSRDNMDSFVYHLSEPYTDAGVKMAYSSGYSYQSPFKCATTGGCTGFNYDSTSGKLQFKATKTDASVVDFSVDQYRKDNSGKYQYFGTVTRDVVVTVIDLSNDLPEIRGDKDTFFACANSSMSTTFYTKDADNGDSVDISASRLSNFGISLDIKSGVDQSLTVKWSPQPSDIREQPYRLLITARDHANIRGITQKLIYIYVLDSFPHHSVTKTYNGCGSYTYRVTGDTSAMANYAWSINNTKLDDNKPTFTFRPANNGNFNVELLLSSKSGCTSQYLDNLHIKNIPSLIIDSIGPVCPGTAVKLNATGAKTYVWTSAAGDTLYGSPTIHPKYSIMYYLAGTNDSGCVSVDSVWVPVDTFHVRAGNDTMICSGKGATLAATKLEGYTYTWTPSTGLSSNNGYKVIAHPTKDITYTVTATSPQGCVSQDSMRVHIFVPKVSAGADTRVCKGDSVQLHATGGSAYYWFPYNGMSKNNQVADPYVHPISDQQYVVSIHDSLDCHVFLDTVMVRVDSLREFIHGNTEICSGDKVELRSLGGDTHYWTPSQFFDDPHATSVHASPDASRWLYVTATDTTTGCSKKDSIYIHVSNNCVWPGDANYDGTANYLDLLNVGVGYGKTGHSRANATESWQQQLSPDWSQSTAEGINYKEIDANGDGMINASDTDAIVNNYGKTHSGGHAFKDSTGDIPLYFAFDRDTFYAGDTVHATLNIGNQNHSVSALYGVGMQFSGSMAEVKDKSYSFSFNNSILGNNNTPLDMYRAGILSEASIVRTDQKNISGYGSLAQISYVLKDSTYPYLSNGEWIHLHLQYARAIDNTGKPIAIKLLDDSAIVFKARQDTSSNGIGILKASSFVLYPNPADRQLIVESRGLHIQKLQIANMLGQEVLSVKEPTRDKLILDVSTLHTGFYIVEIQTSEGYARYKINIAR